MKRLNTINENTADRLTVDKIENVQSEDESVTLITNESTNIESENCSKDDDEGAIGGLQRTLVKSIEANQASLVHFVQSWGKQENSGQLDDDMLENLNLCGSYNTSHDWEQDKKLFEPVVLKHTHSTPIVHSPSILNEGAENEASPGGEETLSRSRSTPLSTSLNSAFGKTLPSMPELEKPVYRSAFIPPYRLKPTYSDGLQNSCTFFNPIRDELDTLSEFVSIEVMHMTQNQDSNPSALKIGSKIAQFLADIRNFRWKRRSRGGRENPARPSSSDGEGNDEDTTASGSGSSKRVSKMFASKRSSSQADSGEVECQSEENADDIALQSERVCIRVSRKDPKTEPEYVTGSQDVASQMEVQDVEVSNSRIAYSSPETASVTTNTTGHATQSTSNTYGSRRSQLSSISETDREVMELNNGGQDGSISSQKEDQLLMSIPLSSVRNGRYAGLEKSPNPLRDGANVPADRFFTLGGPQSLDRRSMSRQTTMSSSSRRSGSQATSVSGSSANTSSTSSSMGDEPPIFVSYLDRKTVSDLTTSRFETSSPRAGDLGKEQREASPSDKFLGQVISKKPHPIRLTRGFQYGKRVANLPPRSPVKSPHSLSPDLPFNSIIEEVPDLEEEEEVLKITVPRSTPHSKESSPSPMGNNIV